MSIPQIPENCHRPELGETLIDLLESIALEEISLSHILNAEAERIHAFIGKNQDFPTCPSNIDIIYFNKTSSNLLDTVIMKEWILYKKLLATMEIMNKTNCCSEDNDKHERKQ